MSLKIGSGFGSSIYGTAVKGANAGADAEMKIGNIHTAQAPPPSQPQPQPPPPPQPSPPPYDPNGTGGYGGGSWQDIPEK